MLTQLNIKDLAIIDELSIDFTRGFNVITGETGAGKSILIKALNLLLGNKVCSDVVRKGSRSAIVSGAFLVPENHGALACLRGLGVGLEAERGVCEVLIRRSISSKGRSSAWINDTPITVSSLKTVGTALIDVFGQHENGKILDPSKHTFYLDQFLTTKELPGAIGSIYKGCAVALRDLKETVSSIQKAQRTKDYLRYRHEELCLLDPSREDFDAIQEACRNSGKSLVLKEQLSESQHTIDRGAMGASLGSLLWGVASSLQKISNSTSDRYTSLAKDAEETASRLDDLSFGLDQLVSSLDFDEDTLEENQMRLSIYQDFFRKLGVSSIEGLLEEKSRLSDDLAFIETASQSIEEKLRSLLKLTRSLRDKSRELRLERSAASDKIKIKVEAEFEDLAMPGATFDVSLENVKTTMSAVDLSSYGDEAESMWSEICEIYCGHTEVGSERAIFLLSSNPGEPSMPLQKIASGGEVSRIMLALKKSLAAGANTCVLVFDEIDSGISGRVASMVGKKMQELSTMFQVVCISHLAQVAACADSHFLVHKFGKRKRTESTITMLSKRDSTKEIARLLSGDEISKVSLQNARSLRERALPALH